MTAARQAERCFSRWLRAPLRLMRRLRTRGWRDTWQQAVFHAHTAGWEYYLGIHTRGSIARQDLSDDPTTVDYEAVGYRTLARALRFVNVAGGAFLDLGCGKGRPLAVAATRHFSRVVGVDQSAALCGLARENLQRLAARGHRRCGATEVLQADAKTFEIPEDVSVVFLFNPFTGHILEAVLENLRVSLGRRPRPLSVLYVLPVQATDCFAACDWLACVADELSEGLRLRVYRAIVKTSDNRLGTSGRFRSGDETLSLP
jgi:SAM-dependent methyltransferase